MYAFECHITTVSAIAFPLQEDYDKLGKVTLSLQRHLCKSRACVCVCALARGGVARESVVNL